MTTTKFKNTEIGRIPEDWEVKQLGELLTVCNGRDYKHLGLGPVPVYGTGGVVAWVDDYLYDGETVCIGRKGTIDKPQYHTGKIWTIDTLFYTRNFSANPLFLYYKCTNVNWNLINEATGVPSLTSQNIENVKISLPPTKEEQSRIATALYDIDTLIRNLDRTIEKKKNIRQGAMEQLLSGKKRLPGFKGEWVNIELGEVCKRMKRGETLNATGQKGKYPIIAAGIEPAGYCDKYNREPMCVSVSGSGANAGYVSFHRSRIFATDCFTIGRSNDYEVEFIYYVLKLRQKEIFKLQTGGAQPHVYPRDISNLSILYTKDIKEQRAIANLLTAMDDEIAMLQLERTKYANIRSGMMEDLLSGTKRL